MSSREQPTIYISIKSLRCTLKTPQDPWASCSLAAAHLEAEDECLDALRAAEPRSESSQLLPEGQVLRGHWPGHNPGVELAGGCLSLGDLRLQLQDPRTLIRPSRKPLQLAPHLLMTKDRSEFQATSR